MFTILKKMAFGCHLEVEKPKYKNKFKGVPANENESDDGLPF